MNDKINEKLMKNLPIKRLWNKVILWFGGR